MRGTHKTLLAEDRILKLVSEVGFEDTRKVLIIECESITMVDQKLDKLKRRGLL